MRNAYSVTWDGDTSLFNVSGGIQYWTVPQSANYTFVLGGSQGGFPYTGESPGYGALISGTIYLQRDTILKILVGQSPIQATVNTNQGGAGGGGTFVTLSDNTPLFVAGGGAGNPRSTTAISKLHGISTSGDPYYVSTGRYDAHGGGGSFYAQNNTSAIWGKSFVNGGEGGTSSTDGGFGGGGGSYYPNSFGSGGGGYSGGDEIQTDGTSWQGSQPGGGTSYVISTATSVTRTSGGNTTTLTGFVTITKI
jgi:tripartite motif-containing protein 56